MEGHEEMAWMLRSFVEGKAIKPDGQQVSAEIKFPAGAAAK
jgi:starvation-inducible DNA-binding protein